MSNTKVGVDCCGDRYDVNTSFACGCGCKLWYCAACFDAHCRSKPPPQRTIDLVKQMTIGPCTCYHINGSLSIGPEATSLDMGTRVECARCKARAALEADGIDYNKDEPWQYVVRN